MVHYFEYNGINSREMGVYIRTKQAYDKPQRDLSIISVPGRNGDLVIDNGSYKNLEMTLGLRLVTPRISKNDVESFNYAYNKVVEWLQPTANYFAYSDSYDPRYYRKACIKSALKVTQKCSDIADFNVTFSMKPYKYSFEGDEAIELSGGASFTVVNPENAPSLPKMTIYNALTYDATAEIVHTFAVNDTVYNIKNFRSPIQLDAEMMNLYKGAMNKNNLYLSSTFPVLKPGANTIALVNNVSKIQLIPRWRAL